MKNIHILPTDKPSRLYQLKNDILRLDYKIDKGEANKHIYITSDEEIKPNVYALINKVLCKTELLEGRIVSRQLVGGATMDICKSEYLEIILSTDQDLIKDDVQAIDDEFLEWFVKNPSCEWVEIEKSTNTADNIDSNIPTIPWTFYKIIIPSEEPKQETTLEEFIESQPYYGTCTYEYKEGIEVGAKWQQERMYSEEEVEDFIYKVCGTVARLQGITLNGNHIDTAYKQFKKK